MHKHYVLGEPPMLWFVKKRHGASNIITIQLPLPKYFPMFLLILRVFLPGQSSNTANSIESQSCAQI